ncbi:MAG: hypothetical protein N2485_08020 [bacterium]|nr:hypothetical protein [bacterium]
MIARFISTKKENFKTQVFLVCYIKYIVLNPSFNKQETLKVKDTNTKEHQN